MEKGKLARMKEEDIIQKANDAAAEIVTKAHRRTGVDFLKHPKSR